MAYIIRRYDRYNKWDRDHAHFIFTLNDNPYAIMKVISSSNLPQLPTSIEEDELPETYRLYETFEEAKSYVTYLKDLNR